MMDVTQASLGHASGVVRMSDCFAGNVLLVGGDSAIGHELAASLQRLTRNLILTTRRPETIVPGQRIYLDLAEQDSVDGLHLPKSGGVAFLCAGIASVANCRDAPARTHLTNVTNTIRLSKYLHDAGFRVVFLSTNLVFSGDDALRAPSDVTSPRTEYGRQKVEVEEYLLQAFQDSLIIRLTKVVSRDFGLFRRWKAAIREDAHIQVFSDLMFAPIRMTDVVASIVGLANAGATGVWHVSPAMEISYEQAARALVQESGKDTSLVEAVSFVDALPLDQCPLHPALDASATESFLEKHFLDPVACVLSVCKSL